MQRRVGAQALTAQKFFWVAKSRSKPLLRLLCEIIKVILLGIMFCSSVAIQSAPIPPTRALTAVHGIGPWTTDIYLLSCLGHAEAWPAGDLALQEAARLAFALPVRPTAKDMPCRNPGGRGALWRRECCGGIIARPRQQNPPPAERRN